MAKAIASLGVSLNARTGNFQAGMTRARTSLQGFSQQARGTQAAVDGLKARFLSLSGALAGGFAVVKLFAGLERFNQKMRSSLAIMGDVDAALIKTMRNTAIEVARTTRFSAEQAAESYFFLASAGLNAAQSIRAMPVVAQFAQAGMFDMARATDLLTDAQSALGLTVRDAVRNQENMIRVSDVLVKANTLANASVQQFSESLTRKAGAALKILNKDMEEGVAVLAAFADQGVKASDAGTALNIVLRDLTTKAIRNKRAFAEAGVHVFDATGKMRNLGSIIGDVEDALRGMSDEQRKATLLQLGFADKSVIFLQTLIGTSEKIKGYEDALRSAGGITKEVADKQLTPLTKAWQEMKVGLLEVGDGLSPVLRGFAELVKFVGWFLQGLVVLPKELIGRPINDLLDRMQGIADLRLPEVTGNTQRALQEMAEGGKDLANALDDVADSGDRAGAALRKLTTPDERREKRRMNLGRQAAQLRLDLATPLERFNIELNKLQAMMGAGVLSTATWNRAVMRLREEFDRATGATARRARIEQFARSQLEKIKTPLDRFNEAMVRIREATVAGFLSLLEGAKAIKLAQQELAEEVASDLLDAQRTMRGSGMQIDSRRFAVEGRPIAPPSERERKLDLIAKILRQIRDKSPGGQPIAATAVTG